MVFLASNGYRTIAHDRRGHGRSSRPSGGNEMDTYADDLATLIEGLDLRDAVLIGYSTGGGKGRLERLVLRDSASGRTETVPAAALFVLIGAEPQTDWLPREVVRNERGYVVTGKDLSQYGQPRRGWHLVRLPLLLETSMAGVFAVGDVRQGSVKRVASAVGEGSIVVQLVHEYLRSDSGVKGDDGIAYRSRSATARS